jgi:hypothetical protein
VQALGGLANEDPTAVHAAADAGVQGSGSALPYLARIQEAFGAEHVVQQRAGVALAGGVGRAGDAYEKHADAVAERVVRGESAADLLDAAASSGAGATPAGVQRRSPPGAHAADEEAQDIAGDHAADDIETILDRPDPIAGVGDPTQSLRALDALPLGTLLATLDELDARGRLPEIRQALEHAPVRAERVRTALLVRDMARLPSVRADAAPLAELAMALEGLPHGERQEAFHYMGQQRGLSRSVRMMIEGFLATESANMAAMGQQQGQGDGQDGGRRARPRGQSASRAHLRARRRPCSPARGRHRAGNGPASTSATRRTRPSPSTTGGPIRASKCS